MRVIALLAAALAFAGGCSSSPAGTTTETDDRRDGPDGPDWVIGDVDDDAGNADPDTESDGDAEPPPGAAFAGVLFEPERHTSGGTDGITAWVRAAQSRGITTIVVPWIDRGGRSLTGEAERAPWAAGGFDVVRALLDAAAAAGIEVFLGIEATRDPASLWSQAGQDTALERIRARFNALTTRYADAPAFVGLYVGFDPLLPPLPVSDALSGDALVNAIAALVKGGARPRRLMISARDPGPSADTVSSADVGRDPWGANDPTAAGFAQAFGAAARAAGADVLLLFDDAGRGLYRPGRFALFVRNVRDAATAGGGGPEIVACAELWTQRVPEAGLAGPLTAALPAGAAPARAGELTQATNRVFAHGEEALGLPGAFARPAALPENDEGRLLFDKAERLWKRLQRSLLRDGLVVPALDAAWPFMGDDERAEGDAVKLTGLLTAALSLRAAALDTPDAWAELDPLVDALRIAATISPSAGEIVRSFTRAPVYQVEPLRPGAGDRRRWYASIRRNDPAGELYRLSDADTLVYGAWVLGASVYLERAPDSPRAQELKRALSTLVTTLTNLDMVAQTAVGTQPVPAAAGDFAKEPFVGLGLLFAAVRPTGQTFVEARARDYADTRNWRGVGLAALSPLPASAVRFRAEAAGLGLALLTLYERAAGARALDGLLLRWFADRRVAWGDPWFALLDALRSPPGDSWARFEAGMLAFDPDNLENRLWAAKGGTPSDAGYVPVGGRAGRPFEWLWPTSADGGTAAEGEFETRYPGVGYLLAYWLGRHFDRLPDPPPADAATP